MSHENPAAEPAPAQPDDAALARPEAATMTRAQWRRLAAEAERAAAAPVAPAAEAPDEPFAAAVAASELDELVLSVVDGDARVVTPPSAPAQVPSAPETRRRRHGASFGVAADETSSVLDIPAPAPLPDERLVDDFEFAARLFSFTAQTPVEVAAEAIAVREQSLPEVAAPRRGRVLGVAKRLSAASFSLAAMAAVGVLAAGVITPAVAVFAEDAGSNDILAGTNLSAKVDADEIQAYVSSSDTGVTFDRDDSFDVTSVSEIAADSGVTIFAGTWVNDPNGAVQWPFPVGVPVSAAYGSSTYLSQFSTPHRGVDLTPGAGADVHAVAAGTVRIATSTGGDYGVTVVIDHVIDGEVVSTRYAHMQYDSLQVEVGDTVAAGEVVGKVGATGKATGPHLHLEVLLGGNAQTDPMAWLEEHTKG